MLWPFHTALTAHQTSTGAMSRSAMKNGLRKVGNWLVAPAKQWWLGEQTATNPPLVGNLQSCHHQNVNQVAWNMFSTQHANVVRTKQNMNQQPFEKNTLEVFETIYGSRDSIDTPNSWPPMVQYRVRFRMAGNSACNFWGSKTRQPNRLELPVWKCLENTTDNVVICCDIVMVCNRIPFCSVCIPFLVVWTSHLKPLLPWFQSWLSPSYLPISIARNGWNFGRLSPVGTQQNRPPSPSPVSFTSSKSSMSAKASGVNMRSNFRLLTWVKLWKRETDVKETQRNHQTW